MTNLNCPTHMCRVCESTEHLTDLSKEMNRSIVKKLRAVADITVSVDLFRKMFVSLIVLYIAVRC